MTNDELDRTVLHILLRHQGKANRIGRWMASTEAEFWEFYSYYVKPIKSRADVARALKKAALEKFPNLMQPSLFDYVEMESV